MWAYYALMAALAAYGTYSAVTADKGMPQRPVMSPPDFEPLQEFGEFTNYQNDTRNQLLAEYYGGVLGESELNPKKSLTNYFVEGGSSKHSDPFGGTKPDTKERGYVDYNSHDWDTDPATSRSEVSFTGRTPSNEYSAAQLGILGESQANFKNDLGNYFQQRGMDPGAGGTGAAQELKKDYRQKALEINSKSHDIYAMTLGSLMGEVSDAGQQAGQLVGNVGLAAQSDQQQRDASYARAMQKWQYQQGQPTVAGAVGSMLPYLYGMYNSGAGTPAAQTQQSPYGPYASGYQYPGATTKLPWEG